MTNIEQTIDQYVNNIKNALDYAYIIYKNVMSTNFDNYVKIRTKTLERLYNTKVEIEKDETNSLVYNYLKYHYNIIDEKYKEKYKKLFSLMMFLTAVGDIINYEMYRVDVNNLYEVNNVISILAILCQHACALARYIMNVIADLLTINDTLSVNIIDQKSNLLKDVSAVLTTLMCKCVVGDKFRECISNVLYITDRITEIEQMNLMKKVQDIMTKIRSKYDNNISSLVL